MLKDISISSMLEEPKILEGLTFVLSCIGLLTFSAIITFILYNFYLYVMYSNVKEFKSVFLNKMIYLIKKSGKVYAIAFGGFTLFYLMGILFLDIKLIYFLKGIN